MLRNTKTKSKHAILPTTATTKPTPGLKRKKVPTGLNQRRHVRTKINTNPQQQTPSTNQAAAFSVQSGHFSTTEQHKFGSLTPIYNKKKLRQAGSSVPSTTTTTTTTTHQLAQDYDPSAVEADWDDHWQHHGLFTPSLLRSNKFVMLLPPPNVTGTLHLGHALTVGIQDTITRYKRMAGHSTLWVPGVDHAGIATQVVVEKQLKRTQNKSRHDLGRDAFIKQVWDWKEKYGDTIFGQLRRLGTSLDWTRSRFTLDETCAEAVLEAFMRLYDSDIIYRDNRIVSWCCTLRSAISTIEIDTVDIQTPTFINIPNFPKPVEVGVIHDFKYKIVTKRYAKKVRAGELQQDFTTPIDQNDHDNFITISTTRMETMLGDVAVAVHPDDPRYAKFKRNKSQQRQHHQRAENNDNNDDSNNEDNEGDDDDLVLEHPLIPGYFIPVIFDDVLVDMNFGTGAVKITPAHDPNDYQSAIRNNLPLNLTLLDDKGHFSHPFHPDYNELHRYEVRERVIDTLTKRGFYAGKRPNPMAISICSRSGDLIEPMIKPQWWIRSQEMALNGKTAAEQDIEIESNTPGNNFQINSIATLSNSDKNIKKKKLSFTPTSSYSDWSRWLDNNQDWCISRQLWWGHRIPAWYMSFEGDLDGAPEDPERWVIAKDSKHAEAKAAEILAKKYPNRKLKQLTQDEDVLDTWFSSGLFPFSVMGWPHEGVDNDTKLDMNNLDPAIKSKLSKNKDFLRFFPGSLLETGNDILFFWVARMVMLSQTLTGALPFEHVYLHTLIRDKSGRKMSKSLGNVIDPLDVINGVDLEGLYTKLKTSNLPDSEIQKAKAQQESDFPQGIPACGADSLRFGLLSYTKQSGDINLDINSIISARHFNNKIWQAMRFTMGNIAESEDIFTPPMNGFPDVKNVFKKQAKVLQQRNSNTPLSTLEQGTFEQQWLLNRLTQTVDKVNQCFEQYQFGEATQLLQKFFLDDLCSRFLEISKTIVRKSFHRNGVEEPNVHYHPDTANATLNTLYYTIETFLKLLHPISPHLTEELWFSLPAHLERIQKQSGEVENDIVTPILATLNKIKSELPTDLNPTVRNIAINKGLYEDLVAQRSTKGSSFAQTMDRYLDHTAFDLGTYVNRVNHIKKINNNKLKYEMHPEDQLLSEAEIQTELDAMVTRVKSGSISAEPFPTIGSSDELMDYHGNTVISAQMEKLMDVIDKVRVVKARLQIPNHIKPRVILEYITPEGDSEGNSNPTDTEGEISEQKMEESIMNNLGDYQHIISILAFVSQPSVLKSTVQSSSLKQTDDGTESNRKGSYPIKQYISDNVLCHIIIDTNDSNTASTATTNPDKVNSTQQPPSVDFSSELVKSERRVASLTTLTQQLEENIKKTKDNPKVPEKVKLHNSQSYNSGMKELIVLSQNITSLKQLVPPELYTPVKIADLHDQISLINKAKDKVVEVMNGNTAKGKGSSNTKHQETVNGFDAEISALQSQIDTLSVQ